MLLMLFAGQAAEVRRPLRGRRIYEQWPEVEAVEPPRLALSVNPEAIVGEFRAQAVAARVEFEAAQAERAAEAETMAAESLRLARASAALKRAERALAEAETAAAAHMARLQREDEDLLLLA